MNTIIIITIIYFLWLSIYRWILNIWKVNGKDNGQKIEKYYNEVKLFYLNIGFPNTHTQKKKKKKKKKKKIIIIIVKL